MSRQERAVKNVLVSIGTQLLAWAMTFAVTLYLPRYLGDQGLGKFALATAFIAVLDVIVPLGTNQVLVKEVAQNPSRAGQLLAAALVLRMPLALGLIGVAALLAFLLGYDVVTQQLVFLMALAMLVNNINAALSSILIGQEKMSHQSIPVLAEKFLSSTAILLLIFMKGSLPAIAAVSVFSSSVAVLLNFSALRALLPGLRLPTRQTVQALATAGLPFMGWTVFQTLYGRTDPIVMRFLATDEVIGWYDLPARLVGATLFFPAAITTALLPMLTALHAEGAREFDELSRRLFSILLVLGIPIAVLLCCLPHELILLLHYPAGFVGSEPVLRVAGVGALLYFVAMGVGTMVIAADGQHRMFRASMGATCLGIPLCCVFSYLTQKSSGNAAVGAMASDVALEVFLLVAYLRILPRGTLPAQETFGLVFRCFAAALPMLVLLLLPFGTTVKLLLVLPAALLYLGGCLLLRCVDVRYLSLARSLFLRRTAGAVATRGGS